MHISHEFYLAYHHFDFLLVDYPAFHAGIGIVALTVLALVILIFRRQKRMEARQKKMEKYLLQLIDSKAL